MKILFVEDEKELNEIGTEQMRAKGHEVWQAYTVEEARALLESEGDSVDLLIADHQLPDGEGIQLVMEVRAQKPSIKVTIVSAYLHQMEMEILKNESIPFFHKPVLYSDVLKKLPVT